MLYHALDFEGVVGTRFAKRLIRRFEVELGSLLHGKKPGLLWVFHFFDMGNTNLVLKDIRNDVRSGSISHHTRKLDLVGLPKRDIGRWCLCRSRTLCCRRLIAG